VATKTKQIKKAAEFLFEVGSLRKIIRAHRQSLLTDDLSDNIASHTFRVTWVGFILSKMEGVDPSKVTLMCLAHDVAEARSGDQNWVHKRYVKVFEDEIIHDQITGLPGEKDLKATLSEYHERKTKEALVAKDADLIDQMMLLKEYIHRGNKEAVSWLASGKGNKKNKHFDLLKTKSGIKLAKEILKQTPSDWWKDVWTEKRR
jgi:putative hydrolase of HD superfamily